MAPPKAGLNSRRLPRGRLVRRIFVLGLPLMVCLAWLPLHRQATGHPRMVEATPPDRQDDRQIARPRIVVLVPLSGMSRPEGEMLRGGIQMAWNEIRSEAAIEADLTILDSGEASGGVVQSAEDLASDDSTLLVLAHLPISDLSRLIPIYEEKQVPLLVPASSHQSLVGHSWVLPFISPDRAQGAYAAKAAKGWAQKKKAYVIYESGTYGRLLLEGFKEAAKREGLKFEASACTAGDAAANRLFSEIAQKGPEVIWLAGLPLWGAAMADGLAQAGYRGRLLVPASYGSLLLDDLFGAHAENLYVLRPVSVAPDEVQAQAFCDRFLRCHLQQPSWLAVLGYDAMRLAGEALKNGCLSRSRLRGYFLGHDSRERAYHGVGGSVFIGKDGVVNRPFHITGYKNGRFVPVAQ